MPDEALEASNEGAPEGGSTDAAPEGAARGAADDRVELREAVMEAMLVACGERGYNKVAVRHVLEGYGGNRAQFYELFADKAECYAAAYEWGMERLSARLVDAAVSAGEWRAGLRAGLAELARFIRMQPLIAKGLLVEVQVAGGRALTVREAVMERLSRAIDSARRETESRHSPPPVTASFMVSAIDGAVVAALERDDPQSFAAVIPELAHMVVSAYFGEEAGREELEPAPRS
jgi:AcrR family transcriptional regulator